MSFIYDYLIALYSKIHTGYYKNTLQHYTRYSWICGEDFQRGQSNKFFIRKSRKMKNHCYRPAAQGFSSEISRGRRAAKFGRNLTNYMSVQHFWDLSRLMGLFLLFTCKFILKLRPCNERASQNYRPWYKKLCHWRISELIVVKRANDDLW